GGTHIPSAVGGHAPGHRSHDSGDPGSALLGHSNIFCPLWIGKSGYASVPISGPSSPSISVSGLTRIGVIMSEILNQTYAITKAKIATTMQSISCMKNCDGSP